MSCTRLTPEGGQQVYTHIASTELPKSAVPHELSLWESGALGAESNEP